jgi:hypothetical protein
MATTAAPPPASAAATEPPRPRRWVQIALVLAAILIGLGIIVAVPWLRRSFVLCLHGGRRLPAAHDRGHVSGLTSAVAVAVGSTGVGGGGAAAGADRRRASTAAQPTRLIWSGAWASG